jgi:hypothetical protein
MSLCIVILLTLSIDLAQDIHGKWKGQMEGSIGAMVCTYTFKIAGDSLSGTIAHYGGITHE